MKNRKKRKRCATLIGQVFRCEYSQRNMFLPLWVVCRTTRLVLDNIINNRTPRDTKPFQCEMFPGHPKPFDLKMRIGLCGLDNLLSHEFSFLLLFFFLILWYWFWPAKFVFTNTGFYLFLGPILHEKLGIWATVSRQWMASRPARPSPIPALKAKRSGGGKPVQWLGILALQPFINFRSFRNPPVRRFFTTIFFYSGIGSQEQNHFFLFGKKGGGVQAILRFSLPVGVRCR